MINYSPLESRSNYTFAKIDGRIHISDACNVLGGMSVTNNAENVIQEVKSVMDIEGITITYLDTDGQIDELVHDDGKFTRFASWLQEPK